MSVRDQIKDEGWLRAGPPVGPQRRPSIESFLHAKVKRYGALLIFLCPTNDLPESQSRGFVLDDQRVFAVRRQGRVFAYQNRCPHRGVPLEWVPDAFLDSSASLIRCATHGALFLIENGECVAGPCEGRSLAALPCEENAQGIWISLPADED